MGSVFESLTREAVEINGPQEVEELHPMLGILGKVLVDHLQGALKHILHDNGDLVLHQCLDRVSRLF